MTTDDTIFISPILHETVAKMIIDKSRYPEKALLLWASLLCYFDRKTGAIIHTPTELSQETRCTQHEAQAILKELASWQILREENLADSTRYYMHEGIVQINRMLNGLEVGEGNA